jgi:hypothetical protein
MLHRLEYADTLDFVFATYLILYRDFLSKPTGHFCKYNIGKKVQSIDNTFRRYNTGDATIRGFPGLEPIPQSACHLLH